MSKKSRQKNLKSGGSPTESTKRAIPEGTERPALLSKASIHILIIAVVGLLIYSNTFNIPFIFDDIPNIAENLLIKDLRYFTNKSMVHDIPVIYNVKDFFYSRLLGYLTFALNYKLHGLNVTGYHAFNLAVHLINAISVYYLIRLTTKTPFFSRHSRIRDYPVDLLAFFGGVLFVAHPIATQAVTYIIQRFASLATMFYLLSVLFYIRARLDPETKYTKHIYALYTAALICAVCAMKTKEIAFTLPMLITAYELMFLEGSARKRTLLLAPFILTLIIIPVSLVQTNASLLEAGRMEESMQLASSQYISRWDYLLTQFRVITTYIRLLLLPVNQNLDYDYPIYNTLFSPAVVISLLFIISIAGVGVYLYVLSNRPDRDNRCWLRLASFGILWFFVSLSVESSIIPIADVIFEHRVYLPSVGFILALLSVYMINISKFERFQRTIVVPVAVLIVMAFSIAAYARNNTWRNSIAIWEDVVQKSPNKIRPHNNLGADYYDQGRFNEAIRQYETSIQLKPGEAYAYLNLGIVYEKQGNLDEASRLYNAALKINPDFPDTHNNLGDFYYGQGRFDDAIKEYQTAIRLKPSFTEAYCNLGVVYNNQGRLDEALTQYQQALRLNPDFPDAHKNLGDFYHNQGRFDDAIKEYQTAIRLKPSFTEAYYNLGVVYHKQGRLDEALTQYQQTLRLNPDHANTHNNLGVIYSVMGKVDEAIKEYQTAIRLNPAHPDAQKNLDILMQKIKKGKKERREGVALPQTHPQGDQSP
ncbi:MAG: tetratricopeptide repeat protein [Nitrospirae bacterium]|nr:tetratricopeptide repeat protein [Nitrospirota bacterium]